MAKRKHPAKFLPSQSHRQVVSREQISITREVNYIIKRAQESDARIIRLGSLVLFSTSTGDAWLLDPEDNLALCLARDGERQSFTVTETAVSYGIEWNANYRIDGDAFIVAEHSGQTRTILGYPTSELLQAMRGAR
jgi:hypothetical protein